MKLFGINIRINENFFKKARFTRNDILTWGTIAALAFLAFLIIWDGYVFYTTLFKGRTREGVIMPSEGMTLKEIEEVIEMLDEQKRRFEQIFGAPLYIEERPRRESNPQPSP